MPAKKRRPRNTSRKTKSRKKPGLRSRRSASSRIWLKRIVVLAIVALAGYIFYLDTVVRQKFDGSRWAIPSHIYSRPLEIFPGQVITRQELVVELKQLGYRAVAHPDSPGTFAQSTYRVRIYLRGFDFWDERSEPRIIDVRIEDAVVTALHDAHGGGVASARLEPRLFGSISPGHHEDRELVRRENVPKHLVNALVAVEDRGFYSHFGVDPKGLARAMWANISAGGVVQGGSTLTQQLAKNFFLTRERTIQRKLTEMLMALLLEAHYDKDEILEAYINEVYLGQSGNRAIHGFGLASLFYFGRPLDELQVSELALLTALVKGASYYNPFRSPERARQRRNLVLEQMVELGTLDAATAAAAAKAPLGVTSKGALSSTEHPAYLDYVRLQLRRDYREEDLRKAGLHIITSLDPRIQGAVETSLRQRLVSIETSKGLPGGSLQSAALVVRTDNGEVVALAGGREPRFAGFNRALEAERPVGSLIKPVVFLAALESGYSLASMLDDGPLVVEQAGAPAWKPQNYDGKSHGTVRLIDALSYSYNIATARLGMEIGIGRPVRLLQRLGLRRQVDAYPSFSLGAVNMTPVEMTQMYLGFASGGFLIPLRTTRSVLDQEMKPLARYPLSLEQVIDGDQMTALNAGLQAVVAKGTARSLSGRFPSSLELAGKTGTTNGYRDSWFAGYGGNYLAVVWVGRDDNKPTGLTGASGAMRIWADIMHQVHIQPVDIPVPASVEYVEIDQHGQVATGCQGADLLPFAPGTVPDRYASCARKTKPRKAPDASKNWLEKLFDTGRK